ncbi:MAG: DEAD/DEAH box helicase [Candidatus Buchananbacteria bacterium]|nr:DEAD/DEAH box helicase [Candidatus Buchananbacteria bacterium]
MQISSEKNFLGLGIAPSILSVIQRHKFIDPTPIQAKAIPIALEGKDLVGIAQTGTGKTLAFGIPMIQYALQNKGIGLIVLPTRELALQVKEVLHLIGASFGIRTALLIGGAPMWRQISDIRRQPNIIIGTPGRIIDHLDQRILNLSGVKMLVLDEADRMLDMGFAPQLKRILQFVPAERQTLLFSATMPPPIMQIARAFMKLPVQIEIVPSGTAATNVTHEVFIVPREKKGALLIKLLGDYRGSVLIFMRTKFGAKKVARDLRNARHTAVEIHSNRSLGQRREALDGFKNGRYRILVATDIAARGIDVTGIELVLNYDLPMQAEDYVHRIGRTGRAGASGHAISFATPDQQGDLRTIEKLLRKSLPLAKLPESLPTPPPPPPGSRPSHSGHQNYSRTNRSFSENRKRRDFNQRRRY